MKLTTKSKYAVNALTDLASIGKDFPVSLTEISSRQNIELNYLEQLFRKLRIAGIVKSVRGRHGGYKFAITPASVSIKDIMEAVEEDLDATHCSGKRTCIAGKRCTSHELWNDLNEVVQDYLSRIYIFDLVDSSINTNIDTKEIN